MRTLIILLLFLALPACQSPTASTHTRPTTDACGAAKFQHLVGGPVTAAQTLKINDQSRYYGRAERIDPNTVPTRLNFVVSTDSVVDSIANPKAKIIRVFCG